MKKGSDANIRDVDTLPYSQAQISGDFVAATVSVALLPRALPGTGPTSPLVVPGTVLVDEYFDLLRASDKTLAVPRVKSPCSEHGHTTIHLFPLYQLASIIDLNTPDGKRYSDIICTRLNNEALDLWQHRDIYQDQLANVELYTDYIQILQRLFKTRGKIDIPVRYGEFVPLSYSRVWAYVTHLWMDDKQINMCFSFVWAGIWSLGETAFSSLHELGIERRIRIFA